MASGTENDAGLDFSPAPEPRPAFTGASGNHYITPADFAKIYDVTPVYATNNTGAAIGSTPQHVAIIATSDANAADVQAFATGIGSSSYHFNVVLADGVSPGYTGSQREAELDLERVLGTAPGVQADLVEGAGSTPLYDAAKYAVVTLQDPVITMSFGECEPELTAAGSQMWQNLWSIAAGNMSSVFVSGGDSGAASCTPHGVAPTATQFRAVSGFCSTPYNTCVGGTEFADTANPSQYWGQNDPTTKASVLSYIPEGAWNDPTRVVNGVSSFVILEGGGGVSQFVAKPDWQTGLGVPNDGYRDIPDISFSASASHDAYYYCGPNECTVAGQSSLNTFIAYGNGGTSASTPSMAGIAALLNTAAGARQGNLNPMIYRLANSAVAGQVFHDVTLSSAGVANCDVNTPSLCNNTTPGPNALTGGQAGFVVAQGYDLATGWGSLDVSNFVRAAVPVSTSLALTATGTAISTSQSIILSATLSTATTSLASPTGSVQFYVNGAAFGSPVALSGISSTSGSLSFPAIGTYAVTASYSGDALYVGSTAAAVQVVVAAQIPSFSVAATLPVLTFASGATTGNTNPVTLTSTGNYTGTVTLACTITASSAAAQPTCGVTPASPSLGADASATVTVTINTGSAVARSEPPGGAQRMGRTWVTTWACCVCLGLPFARHRRVRGLLLASVCFVGLDALSGCSSSRAPTPVRSSAGSYTVTITASGKGTGALNATTASTTFAVAIN